MVFFPSYWWTFKLVTSKVKFGKPNYFMVIWRNSLLKRHAIIWKDNLLLYLRLDGYINASCCKLKTSLTLCFCVNDLSPRKSYLKTACKMVTAVVPPCMFALLCYPSFLMWLAPYPLILHTFFVFAVSLLAPPPPLHPTGNSSVTFNGICGQSPRK